MFNKTDIHRVKNSVNLTLTTIACNPYFLWGLIYVLVSVKGPVLRGRRNFVSLDLIDLIPSNICACIVSSNGMLLIYCSPLHTMYMCILLAGLNRWLRWYTIAELYWSLIFLYLRQFCIWYMVLWVCVQSLSQKRVYFRFNVYSNTSASYLPSPDSIQHIMNQNWSTYAGKNWSIAQQWICY